MQAYYSINAMNQNQTKQHKKPCYSKICSHYSESSFLSRYSNFKIRYLNHTHIICPISNCTSSSTQLFFQYFDPPLVLCVFVYALCPVGRYRPARFLTPLKIIFSQNFFLRFQINISKTGKKSFLTKMSTQFSAKNFGTAVNGHFFNFWAQIHISDPN